MLIDAADDATEGQSVRAADATKANFVTPHHDIQSPRQKLGIAKDTQPLSVSPDDTRFSSCLF